VARANVPQMAFSEQLKHDVRRKAHMSCCLCKAIGVEVHHIISQEEGGPDSEDNAAPLCPSCHETYGANPVKRKFIREARDLWYEICAKRYVADPDRLDELKEMLKNAVTYEDFQAFKEEIMDGFTQSLQTPRAETEILAEIDKLFDQVWYNRHLNWKYRVKRGVEPRPDPALWKIANSAAQRVRAKYPAKELGACTDFQCGMINGKLSSLRWVLGDDWDFLDT
jgi:hypothetical protein